nr:hypothetical protein [Tanacetum cinerariifolium]
MTAYLTKSDASEGFDQIIEFSNASSIKYALTVNPNIYVSCIKQFWTFVSMKKVNDVTRLQTLIDKKKVVITEATIRDALRLDDAEGINCLPNEEIFTELARMGYEKPSTKLTFYKAFFSKQWKFLIHTILQCMSAKRTSWNVFSSSWLQLSFVFPQVEILIFLTGEGVAEGNVDDVNGAGVAIEGAASINKLERRNKQKVSKLRRLKRVETSQKDKTSDDTIMDDVSKQGRMIADMDADVDVTLKDIAKDVLSMQDDEVELAELQEVVEVVTTAKIITKVVTAASATITATAPQLTTAAAPTLTTAPNAARRRKGVLIRDPKETATPSTIIPTKAKSKDKRKGILDEVIDHVQRKEKEENVVKRYQALKKKPQTEPQAMKNMMVHLRNMAVFKMGYFKGMNYDDIRLIFKKYFKSNVAFLEKTKEQMEEEERWAIKRINETQKEKVAKKQKLDEEVPVVDYEIYTENNKTYYKIIRANGSPQLFLSFLSLWRNFDQEDLEVLWELVKERFTSFKPKNFSDDFLLTTLTYMFEKPDVQAQE